MLFGKILFKKCRFFFKHHKVYTLYDICFTGAVTANDTEGVGATAKEVDANVVSLVVVARGKVLAPVVAAGA